ncbi:MAG TPA: FkbM family methyltransferase [Chitinophagaceae bacterium]|jgi:FkbM family methyltransferase
MKNLIRKIVNKIILPHSRLVYAQAGEDVILDRFFYKSGIQHPSYLDIGANHPAYISNTYFFYLRGSKGVCIEPNPRLAQYIRKQRPRDTVLNVGVGIDEQTEADFYLFPDHADGLSTFSKNEAEHWQEVGMKGMGKISYEKIIKVPLQTINSVIGNHFTAAPDLLSIDVEGLDLQILQTLDFNRYRPVAICVETLSYDEQQREHKRSDIIEFLLARDYEIYADTHINTIFYRK